MQIPTVAQLFPIIRLVLCLMAIAVVPQSGIARGDHTSASFGKWRTFCDADLQCSAYTYTGVEGNPNGGHVFSLDRAPKDVGYTMYLSLDGVEPKLSLGMHASVIRYGYDEDLLPHFAAGDLMLDRGPTYQGDLGRYDLYMSGPTAEAIMQRLRPSDILDFEFGDCQNGFLFANFLLDGVTAALAWVDTQQGRARGSVAVADVNPDRLSGDAKNCDR
ncbi:hypothetical protein [Marivita sp. S6314]|uniref:hypothetical protein n=1 Tax=Marivita sp. S6314 TaxID=2926406 RepID=UPI001FF29E64|nr:hypothetical protein [Marivita sp. S6314]